MEWVEWSFANPLLSSRLLKDTTPLQRGIIRHLILIIDLSESMSEKDLRPNRYLLTLLYAQEFVREFFEQNPISQLGVLGLRDGLALRISDLSGNPTDHLTAIQALKLQDPKGLPSLQNGLEMARGALLYVFTLAIWDSRMRTLMKTAILLVTAPARYS